MLTRGAAQLLTLAALIILTSCVQGQQLHSSATGCSVGQPSGTTESVLTLTGQELEEGRLNSSVQSSWDFGIGDGAIKAAAGRHVALACVIALNAAISEPTGSAVFLQPTAIDLANATGLSMENVSLTTNCSAVLQYQAFFCSSYSMAGSLTLRRGAVYFGDWRDGFTSLRNVTLTCPEPAAVALPPCWMTAVRTAGELLDAFVQYVAAKPGYYSSVTIVVAANISITNSSWPEAPVIVGANVVMVGSSRLYRPILDLGLLVALWDLLPAVSVTLLNLTAANLAPTYFSPSFPQALFSPLTERVWAFLRSDKQLHINSSTLVVPSEELLYMKHWLRYLTSPVPEDQDYAAWLKVIDLKVHVVNDSGVYYDSVESFTATYNNVRLTDTLGGHYPLMPVDLGLQNAFGQMEDVPLSAVRQIMNASDWLIAMSPGIMQPDSHGRYWLLLIANFSLTDVGDAASAANSTAAAAANRTAVAPGVTVQLPGSAIVGVGAGLRRVRLDFGRKPNTLGVPADGDLSLRDITLSGLPARAASYDPAAPLDVLASPLWGVALADAAASQVTVQNATLLVSGSELALLQRCLLTAGAAIPAAPATVTFDDGLVAAVREFFTASRVASFGASYMRLSSGTTQRYSLTNVTFRTPVAADGEGDAPEVVVAPAKSGRGGGGDMKSWKVGVIVGCAVGIPLLLALAAGLVLLAVQRRRRQWYGSEGDDDMTGSGGISKKHGHRGSADAERVLGAPGAGSGGISDFATANPNPSQELTNSSQALRPDGRRSDLEVAAPAAARSKGGSATASGSASGGIGMGNAGQSTSTTGVVSQDTSIGAVLQLAAADGGAIIAASGNGSAGVRLPAAPPPGAAGDGHVHSQLTDSFERPPSSTVLGQHGPTGRQPQRLGSAVTAGGGVSSATSVPSSSGIAQQTQSILATGGGVALEQMHALIHVLGRDFNDRQLEVQGLLGKGAHGTVYKGTWRGLPVAVKSMVFSNDSSARQQSRALMEAAISANLAHPNIVTSYSYELREVEHELASISPELARQGGGWRLLIIQEYCDAGPLRRLVDCGFFLTPPKPSASRPKLKLPSVGLMRKDSPSGEVSVGSATRMEAAGAAAAASCSRGSSGSSSVHGNGGRVSPGNGTSSQPPPASPGGQRPAAAAAPSLTQQAGPVAAAGAQLPRPALEPVPSDVPSRPTTALQAARRYVDAALMVARGLQHIHDKNIVHGDLNPNNVLLVRAPGTALGFRLKVADFGLSVRMAEGDSHMSNLFQGSPYYCAPEVVMSGKIGKNADIYSLGIMLWELQNGTRPLWRAGVRLRSYPSLNTAELDFLPETPPRYVRLARDCFHGSKDARPRVSVVVDTLASIKAELDAAS